MDTEWDKMLAGTLYTATDPALMAATLRAQTLSERFNACAPDNTAGQAAALRALLGRLGEGVTIRPRFQCDYGVNIHIGPRTFINFNCVFLDCNRIDIGAEVQIAPGVHIYTATHPLEADVRRSGREYALPVTIEDGAWLGGGVIVCPGVTIGANTVVGAGSVVTRSLAPGVLAVGNPARVVRRL